MPPLTTDSGLTLFVGNNKEIKSLSLSKTKVTDRGLSCLNQLPHLESLIVRETSIGDTGVVSLVRINSLITLDLSNTGITDAVFQFLGSLKNLETLDLSYTKVTGKDLSELAETKLKYLSLDLHVKR
ncbi:MAG: leucine-rich repeat domain-containing protein [Candidatus Omnitrophica bacterium]|nr:leucine-rich repeat domain-containing protein [Candidatus Omnitrophota bacterium]